MRAIIIVIVIMQS